MTSLDERIRTAWGKGVKPLHAAAESLAAEGHEESTILGTLERLLFEVRAAGVDDDMDDHITDVMERFTDWCRDENRIRTARVPVPTPQLPSRG